LRRNPFRSEADAFRLFVLAGAAALVVIAVALVAGDLPAAVLGALLLAFGGFHAARWIGQAVSAPRNADEAEQPRPPQQR
jgi:hypothetical protein